MHPLTMCRDDVCMRHAQAVLHQEALMLVYVCLLQDGIEDMEIMYVGCLPVELDPDEQDVRLSPLVSNTQDGGQAHSHFIGLSAV